MDYKTGDIVLFKTKFKWYNPITYVSVAIRAITGYDYNHVGVVVSNWDKLFLNEAIEKGVISIPLEKRLKGQEILVLRDSSPIDEKKFAVEANSFLGNTGYDFSSLLVFQLIYQITNKWIGRKEENATKRMYCSEYVAYLYKMKDWWAVAPDAIGNDKRFVKI